MAGGPSRKLSFLCLYFLLCTLASGDLEVRAGRREGVERRMDCYFSSKNLLLGIYLFAFGLTPKPLPMNCKAPDEWFSTVAAC